MLRTRWELPGCALVLASWLILTYPALGQGVITTIAGTDWLFPGDGRPAAQAPLGGILSLDIATDNNGNYYICDADNAMVMRVGPDGIVHVVAGNGLISRSGDGGFAVDASLDSPLGVAIDLQGNIYIAEYGGHIRKVTPDGLIQSIAGTGDPGYSGDGGPAIKAQLNQPHGLAVDSAGNLYVADTGNNVIRKISPDGMIVTVAGTGQGGFSGDGKATGVQLNYPFRIALNQAGELFIADSFNARVRKLSQGIITTVAGGGTNFADGVPATQAGLIPLSVAVDQAGDLYILDTLAEGVRKVGPDGTIQTIAGSGLAGFAGDGGPARNARFSLVSGRVTLDASGNILVADDQNRRVREITPDGNIQTIAGNGLYRFSGDGGPATSATLYLPTSVVPDQSGNVFISETGQNRIRKVAPDGTISVYAGNGMQGYAGDKGPAVQAELAFPTYLTIGPDGDLYFSDTFNRVVRRIDASGTISRFVYTGDTAFGADAAGKTAPYGLAFDGLGDLLVADFGTNRLLTINAAATQGAAFAGTGTAGYSGDGGVATNAQLNHPIGLVFLNGAAYFCDSGNNVVRRVAASDLTITTVAGNGRAGYSGDGGLATQASLNNPQGLTYDGQGNLYIADQGNFVIRKIDRNGIITTVAGSPKAPALGDGGPALQAFIGGPTDVTIDAAGNLLIADQGFNRIRAVLARSPSFQLSTNSLSFTAPAGSNVLDQQVNVAGSIPGIPYTVSVPGTASWLTVSPASGSIPATLDITVDPSRLAPGPNQAVVTVTAAGASPAIHTISVSLTVTAPGQASLAVKPVSLTFPFVQQSPAKSRSINVSNAGGGSLNLSLSAATNSGGAWLTASSANLTLGAYSASPVTITADPTGLAVGTYSGAVTIVSAGGQQSVTIPVTITVSAVQQSILIPQTGLTFFALQGGGPTLPQFFNILNTGVGQMQWSVEASTLTGGPWLSAFPANGVSDTNSPLVPEVRLDVNPQKLAPGVYAGAVKVTSPGADNSPQYVSVFLNVLASGRIGPIVQPAGMIFSSVAGAESPGSQAVLLQSLNASPVTFHSASTTSDGGNWITTLPRDGTLTAAQPAQIVVQPVIAGLAAGVYHGTLTISFSDGNTRTVTIVLVVAPGGSTVSAGARHGRDSAASCAPVSLTPVFTFLQDGFTVPAGYPGQMAVQVIDNCGNPMTSGTVTASFSNGDATIRLDSLNNGTWTQTWTPQHNVSPVTITADATLPAPSLEARVQITGGLLVLGTLPVVSQGGVVNGASFAANAPIAPGSLFSVFGSGLANGPAPASAAPLPTILGGSSLLIGGVQAPLTFAAGGQINAVVPYETAVNTTQQVIVASGSSYSTPQPVTVAAAAPGVFVQGATSQGLVFKVDASGAQTLADASNPVHAGDAVVIYCTGLGQVSPAVPTGNAAPQQPLSYTVSPVAVTIGGAQANVFFSGLTPGFVGLYQINAIVPSGVAPGDQVPVVVSEAQQTSAPVLIAVR